jgi:hypothetical protein
MGLLRSAVVPRVSASRQQINGLPRSFQSSSESYLKGEREIYFHSSILHDVLCRLLGFLQSDLDRSKFKIS